MFLVTPSAPKREAFLSHEHRYRDLLAHFIALDKCMLPVSSLLSCKAYLSASVNQPFFSVSFTTRRHGCVEIHCSASTSLFQTLMEHLLYGRP